ncbi:MAG TPA: SigB/SigF/SigG family RNA polymerase sigma factor [Pseudonocardia sp.]|nr:SigB/SigF/SigG family RNA polymerase sigma factor [Pseudonocardia sp.]
MSDPPSRDSEYAHLTPLFEELAALPPDHPDREELRAKLVTGFLPVARHIARRFAGRGEPVDDLEQAGTVGLIGAIDRFQPCRGVDFLSFAVPTITGEIRRHFRDRTWGVRVPRRLKDMQSSMNAVIGPLSQELGRAPRPSELAARMGVPVQEVVEGIEAHHLYRSSSLDELVASADTTLGDTLGSDDAELARIENHQALAPILDTLPERERTILLLRFFGNMTQTQIADRIGISQMHVSRLLGRTLAELRERLAGEG